MYPRLFAGIKRQRGAGKPQKVGAKTQGEEAAELGWLVGSLRRTARAWGFSHDENPLAKPGCPSSIGAVADSRPAGRLEKNISYTYTHTPRDYVPARGKLSRVRNETPNDRSERVSSQVNHQKFCRHRARRPFGKTNRLSIIDGDEKRKGRRQSPAWTSSTRSPIFCASARAA